MSVLGIAANTGESTVPVIARVEQLVGSGDTLLTIGTLSRFGEEVSANVMVTGTVRLTPAEREELIRRLTDHRIVDLTRAAGLDRPRATGVTS